MNPFDSILVATDFSAAANNAVRRAAWLAREHDARLRIMHVVDHGAIYRASKAFSPAVDMTVKTTQSQIALRRLADEMRTTFQVTADVMLKIGDPLEVLVRESRQASLVVLGRRAGGSIKDWVLGTPAGRLLDARVRPVLVVKQTVEGPYRRVLTGLDFTPASDAAALVAAALAPAADLHFTHVFHSRQYEVLRQSDAPSEVLRQSREREEAGVVARMRRRVAAIGLDSRALRFDVAHGTGTPTILNEEQIQGADVVAVGRQPRGKWLDALLGSVSHRVLARAQSDVLVVPSPPGFPVTSPAAAARPLAGRHVDSPELARRWWTGEVGPTHTRAPDWQARAGIWPVNPGRG
ncbi:MAG: universal stress protein [Chromatiales bacterium]|nr:universal stress protein [Chromatiales bacterium]